MTRANRVWPGRQAANISLPEASRLRFQLRPRFVATATGKLCPSLVVDDVIEILTPEAERALVHQAQSGHEDAFGRLMRTHYESVFRLVLSIVHDEHTARDVCQEVWLTVWRNLKTFRGEAKFSTWLHPIAVRRSIDQLRSRQRWLGRFLPFLSPAENEEGRGVAEPAAAGNPRQELEDREGVSRIERAIAALPPKHRAVLALREINGLSYDEIAAAVGIRRGTVMSRLFHARRLLAQKLGDSP
jgi:RNA polymerase sigma-70 factor, ECF subfamily